MREFKRKLNIRKRIHLAGFPSLLYFWSHWDLSAVIESPGLLGQNCKSPTPPPCDCMLLKAEMRELMFSQFNTEKQCWI